MKTLFLFLLIPSLASIGCRSFTSPARSHSLRGGVTWIDYDASRRGTIIVPTNGTQMMVSEPSPDVAIGVVADLVAKGSYNQISAEASAKVTETVAELGKRTQTVMVLRELLFRLNELQLIRRDMGKDEIKDLYLKVMQTVLELAKTDRDNADAAKVREVNTLLRTVGPEKAHEILQKLGISAPEKPIPEPQGRK